jgi:lysozyme
MIIRPHQEMSRVVVSMIGVKVCTVLLLVFALFPQAGRADIIPPHGATTPGIDVNRFQGTINWSAVAAAGEAFAITEAVDGTTFVDPMFQQNWLGIKSAGLIRGAYQFFEPAQNVDTQAAFFLSTVGGFGPGDLPPVLDVEITGGKSKAVLDAEIGQWVSDVRTATGLNPIIYTAAGFWNSSVGGSSFSTDLWIANIGVSAPDVPTPFWSDWQIWQYSFVGSVSGVQGDVDLDKFNGSLASLEAYSSQSASVPEPRTLFLMCAALLGLGRFTSAAARLRASAKNRSRVSPPVFKICVHR